jgi:hypothetical protein
MNRDDVEYIMVYCYVYTIGYTIVYTIDMCHDI